jgi:zinc/manganese transport system permease protein
MPAFTWNLLDDVRRMLAFEYMQNAFMAGAAAAAMGAVLGWFVVVRGETYATHTLANVAFPGAAMAAYFGWPLLFGYFGLAIVAALGLASLAPQGGVEGSSHSATVGAVQAMALALGFLFLTLYHGVLSSLTAFLFGSFLGVTHDDLLVMIVTSTVVIAAVTIMGRRLLFASVDPAVSTAAGVPSRRLTLVFLVLLACGVAEAAQFTGILLVFAVIVIPAATAQTLSARPSTSIALSVVIAVLTVWTGLTVSFYSDQPVGFWVATIGFGLYVAARVATATRRQVGRTRAAPVQTFA